ncbi:MAG: class I SAM-dependent methyltransferase [Hominenteromicrobium sp.]
MEKQTDYQHLNAEIWNNINDCLTDKCSAISHADFVRAQNGELNVTLAGVTPVPTAWFPNLRDADVLGLASGGGQQCPVFAAHGAHVTVMDLSDGQLAQERYVAQREHYDIRIVKSDLSKPFPFADESFDLIFNPVSNCYIEQLQPMWEECARVIRKGGILMMAFVKEEHFMFYPDFKNETVLISRFSLPFNSIRDLSDEQKQARIRENLPFPFSHTLTEQLGGLLKAGFELTDLFEDCDGGGLFDRYMNSYVAVRAVKKA